MNGRPLARRSRTPVQTRRTRPVRRASAGLSTVRAGAALAMLVSAAAIYGVGASPAFDYTKMQLEGVQFTDPAAVEAALAAARGENLFRLSTGPLLAEIERLPTVDHARIDVRLPATLAVTDRGAGAGPRLAGGRGTLPGRRRRHPVREARGRDRRAAGAAAGLPEVDDRRTGSSTLAVGSRLDPVDVDAATRLASLRPADVGSSAVALAIAVDRRERLRR